MNACPTCKGTGHPPHAPWLLCPAECERVQQIRLRSGDPDAEQRAHGVGLVGVLNRTAAEFPSIYTGAEIELDGDSALLEHMATLDLEQLPEDEKGHRYVVLGLPESYRGADVIPMCAVRP